MVPRLFPYKDIRPVQDKLIKDIVDALNNKQHMIIHAPTGIGKTAAVLAPALDIAEQEQKTIFFLTSRHMQHKIAVETLKEIKQKHNVKIPSTDIIAKRFLCPVPGVIALRSGEFIDFCKSQREEDKCEFYSATKKNSKISARAKKALEELKNLSPCHVEETTKLCSRDKLCTYEIITNAAANSRIIIADYNYMFASYIREPFLQKIGKTLDDCIIVVDEAHNIIPRVRDSFTLHLSMFIIDRAIIEADKNKLKETSMNLRVIKESVIGLSKKLGSSIGIKNEALVLKQEFADLIEHELTKAFGKNKKTFSILAAELEVAAIQQIKKQKKSFIAMITRFMEVWSMDDEGFVGILSTKEPKKQKPGNNENKQNNPSNDIFNGFVDAGSLAEKNNEIENTGTNITTLTLSRICLDPGVFTKDVIENSYSTIIMSGTLTPTHMYKDLLGFPENTKELVYPSPFPEENRLSLVIPQTTTKFSKRTSQQFKNIAGIVAEITDAVPGNSFVFFPSYYLRNQVYKEFSELNKKTCFVEIPEMTKKEKMDMLDRFKEYKASGAVMLGVVGGSFNEGIDLPGDLLKAVVVVGIPLQQPDLETQKLIEYYDKKFGKGWDYGYLFPAMNKTMQAAGRCIRSESDRGIVVFLDERYAWENYSKCFPPEANIKITKLYKERVEDFFKNPNTKL